MPYSIIADSSATLTTATGGATAAGVWLLLGIGVLAFLAMFTNQILSILVKRRTLSLPPGSHAAPQPFIVALEKEFVTQRAHTEKADELHRYIKNVDAYAHDEVHKLLTITQAINLHSQERAEMLSALDERTLNQSRVIDGLSAKLDRVVERVADKVEELLRNGGRARP